MNAAILHNRDRRALQRMGTQETREASINRLSRIVSSGIDYRPVRCRREYDFKRGIVEIFRTDTGERVAVRDVYDGERSQPLPGVPAPAEAPAKTPDAPEPGTAAAVPKVEDLPSAEEAADLAEIAVGEHRVKPVRNDGARLQWAILGPGDSEPVSAPVTSYRAACREARKREVDRIKAAKADRKP